MTSHLTTLFLSPHLQISTVLAYTLGPFLSLGGALKLLGWKAAHQQYKRDGYSETVYYSTVIIELLASLSLIPETTRFGGVLVFWLYCGE